MSVLLERLTDPESLEQVGDWIIECATEEELLARVQDAIPLAGAERFVCLAATRSDYSMWVVVKHPDRTEAELEFMDHRPRSSKAKTTALWFS